VISTITSTSFSPGVPGPSNELRNFGVGPGIIPNPVPSAPHSHFRTRWDDPTHQAIEMPQNPTWVLKWRSPHPPEKRAEKRTKLARGRGGWSSAVPVNPFEITRFSGGAIAAEKIPAGQTGGGGGTRLKPSTLRFQWVARHAAEPGQQLKAVVRTCGPGAAVAAQDPWSIQ
jgi:hypothetical protein